jgi:hypothetical protein
MKRLSLIANNGKNIPYIKKKVCRIDSRAAVFAPYAAILGKFASKGLVKFTLGAETNLKKYILKFLKYLLETFSLFLLIHDVYGDNAKIRKPKNSKT